MYKYTNENNQIEEIKPERWGWGVVYKDDTELKQFDGETMQFHRFDEIKKEDIKLFVLYKIDDISKRIDLPISKDMKIIHFYRKIRPFYSDIFKTVYVFGFEKSGKKNLLYILPDDRIIFSDQDNIDLIYFLNE